MKTKPFDQYIHDQCDPPAREAVTRYIKEQWGHTALPYDKYKVDLIIENEFTVPIGYAEVEMRDWEDCPFQTIHIPARKKKLFDNDMPTAYFVINRSLTKGWYTSVSEILASPLVEIPNRRIESDEYFYDVPKEKFIQIELQTI
jgi:hypothetical protein